MAIKLQQRLGFVALQLMIVVNMVYNNQCIMAQTLAVVRRSEHSLKLTPEEINAADELRVKYLQRRAFAKYERDTMATSGLTSARSGLGIGTPNYISTLSVGTPSRNLTVILDTGSDLTWVQCKPCISCYSQVEPIFEPKASTSFRIVGCNDKPKCTYLLGPYKAACAGIGASCQYQKSYLDGSVSTGDFISEVVRIQGHTNRSVSINMGCGYFNKGSMVGYAGILGLSRDILSYPSQTNLSSFATCLPRSSSNASEGFLEFVPAESTYNNNNFICLRLMYTKQTGLYLVVLNGFSITPATTVAKYAASARPHFQWESTSHSSAVYAASSAESTSHFSDFKNTALPNLMIFDTGALNSRLKEADYVSLRNAFVAATSKILTPAPSVMGYDTCFTFVSANNALTKNLLPQVGLRFNGTNSLYILPPASLLYRWTFSTSCFAFRTTTGFAILGNNHQQGRRIHFDGGKNLLCAQITGSSCK